MKRWMREVARTSACFSASGEVACSAVATLLEWLPAALDAQLQADSGLSHFEFGILFALSEAEGRALRMSELAGYANSTLSRLSRAVGRLERKHWVQRAPDPSDGRITVATLTDLGLRSPGTWPLCVDSSSIR